LILKEKYKPTIAQTARPMLLVTWSGLSTKLIRHTRVNFC